MNSNRIINNIKGFLSSQVGLLILGALLSSLIIPWFFQVWQDYQKELEIKTKLIERITESVTRMFMSTQGFILDNNRNQIKTDEEFYGLFNEVNSEYKEWEINSAIIDSQLKAYFPNSNLSEDWGSSLGLGFKKNSFSENVTTFFSKIPIQRNASANFTMDDRQTLIEQKDNFIQRILDSDISFTNNPFSIFWHFSLFLQ